MVQVGYPFDTLKSRLQTDSLTHPRYKRAVHAVLPAFRDRQSLKELYTGLPVCLIRAIPGSAVQFLVFVIVYGLLSAMTFFHKTMAPHMANMEHLVHLDHY